MHSSYHFPDNRLPHVLLHGHDDAGIRCAWINSINPSPEECRELSARYAVPLEYMTAALDANERPRLEHSDNCLLLLLRIPVLAPSDKETLLATCPVAIILTEKVAITVCLRENLVENFIVAGLKGNGMRQNVQLALTVLFRASTLFIDYLRQLNNLVGVIEQTLQKSMQNKELVNMLRIEKSLIFAYTAIKANQAAMEKLRTYPFIHLSEAEKDLLDDVLIENKQASDMADIFTLVFGSVSDAFGAIVSNNLNKVMKLLTGLTLIFMIPSTVGAIYGMNVALPYQESPYAFLFICLACMGITGVFTWLFWKNNWL